MRPIAIGPCRTPQSHMAEVVLRSHPVGPEGHPRGLLTLWTCPVDGWGGYWHDLRYRAEDRGGTGPDLEALPPT